MLSFVIINNSFLNKYHRKIKTTNFSALYTTKCQKLKTNLKCRVFPLVKGYSNMIV